MHRQGAQFHHPLPSIIPNPDYKDQVLRLNLFGRDGGGGGGGGGGGV